jgi:tetratricopeptide (TPR) repeat protein
VLDVVEALVDHSLLRVEPHPGHIRYRMLESIRQYAAEKLAEATAQTALRHAQHFASFGDEAYAHSLDTHGGVERRLALALELENILVGVDASLAAGEPEVAAGCALAGAEVFDMRGPFSDGITLLERVLVQPPGRGTQGRLAHKTGRLLHVVGRHAEALEHYQQALSIAREVRNRGAEGITLNKLGLLQGLLGRTPEALEHYQQALSIHREVGDRQGEGSTLKNLARLHHEQGRISESLAHNEEALSSHREVGNRGGEGDSLGDLAILHREQGRTPEALEHYQQALAIAREVGNRRSEGGTLGNLANLHRKQGRIPEALEHYQQALAIAREVGDRRVEGITLGNLGDLLASEGDLPSAGTQLRAAIVACDETWPMAACVFRGSLALIRAQQGAFDEARAILALGDPQVRGVHKVELGRLLCHKARVEHLAGDPGAAAAALAEAEAVAAELDVGPDSDLGTAIAKTRAAISA